MGYDAVYVPIFWRNILPLSSGWKWRWILLDPPKFWLPTRRHKPDNANINIHSCEILKLRIYKIKLSASRCKEHSAVWIGRYFRTNCYLIRQGEKTANLLISLRKGALRNVSTLNHVIYIYIFFSSNPCTGLERRWGFQEVEAPTFHDNRHMKVAYVPAAFTHMKYAISDTGWVEGLCQLYYDTIGNRTRDLAACSAVPQPTAPPRAARLFQLQEDNPHINQLVHFSTVSILDSKRSNRGSVNQQNKPPPKRLGFLAILLFQSRLPLHLSFISPSSHLSFIQYPAMHRMFFLHWTQKGSNNMRIGSYWLLARLIYPPDPQKEPKRGRNRRIRRARSVGEKECVGVAASQWAHRVCSRGVYIAYSSHVQRPHAGLSEHTGSTRQHCLSHVSRERKKVERGLIVYREVKKFLGVFCPLISSLL
jgi:hypothetical protein